MQDHELSNVPGDVAAALEAGKELGAMKVTEVKGVPVVLTPKGMALHELHDLLPRPARLKQGVVTQTADSFIEYFNEFATDTSVIFCNIDAGSFQGILDYHGDADTPAWGSHKVSHTCQTTKEWDTWSEHNGVKMDQVEFAFFLEQSLDEIRVPAAAQMLEIALTLKAKTKLNFESGQRLSDGQVQFQYREELDGRAGVRGEIQIPEKFKLGLRVFEGGDAFEMDARFRYRIREGKVVMWYDLVRPHKVHRAAVEDVFAKIKQHAAARMVLHGAA